MSYNKMAVRAIRVLPAPVLRQKAKKVTKIDESVQRLIDDMIETMRAAPGVGLAASQIGVPLRVVVIEMPGDEVMALINPEIVKSHGERLVQEGCLSIPGYQGEVKRSVWVKVKAQDRQGRNIRLKGEELLAQALEHEIDHINGVLYVDRVEGTDKLWKLVSESGQEGL
jgi:peptide deformylase